MTKEVLGELIGTFILVFIGCGSVAVAVFLNGLTSLPQVAFIWGIGVALAIYASQRLSPAHLNPAVSVAMSLVGKLPLKKIPFYFGAQLFGAFLAACLLFLIFQDTIAQYESLHSIQRGSNSSASSAMMFGEFYPNPSYRDTLSVSFWKAMLLEGVGTLVLVLSIFLFTEKLTKFRKAIPLFIGMVVTLIIIIVAPYTQAGLNPARDFGPRVFAYLAGWNSAAFPAESHGFFTVYILSPILGAFVAVGIRKFIFNRKTLKISK